jgi:hypothetical protein
MNGHFKHSTSLEGQLAAVAVAVMRKVQSTRNGAGQSEIPGVSDFEEAFRIYARIAELKTRLDERDKLEKGHGERRTELVQNLYVLMAQVPQEFRF